MTTRTLAESLCGVTDADEMERRLLLFLDEMCRGYGVNYSDGERGAARLAANRGGFFWMPCLLCCRWYGGQEKSPHGVQLDPEMGIGVCPHCGDSSKRLNQRWPEGLMHPGEASAVVVVG